MVQVLAHLRGSDEPVYLGELQVLVFSDELRVHLRLLLLGWLGTLPDPRETELSVLLRLIDDRDQLRYVLQAIRGNPAWFDLLWDDTLPGLLRSPDELVLDLVVDYLGTVIDARAGPSSELLRPFLMQTEVWDARIGFCLSRIQDWSNAEALGMLCSLFRRGRGGWSLRFTIRNLALSNPAGGCQALRAHLDYRLNAVLTADRRADDDYYLMDGELFQSVQYEIDELLRAAMVLCPEAIVDHLLGWFVKAVRAFTRRRNELDRYSSDSIFSYGWYSDHRSSGAAFAVTVASALQHVAVKDQKRFRVLASELAEVECLAIQRVLSHGYCADPEAYAQDIYSYLIADPRRLWIGEYCEDSVQLFRTVFRHLDPLARASLETMILKLWPPWERRSPRSTGEAQLQFLSGIPPDLLSARAQDRLGELQRKFPQLEPVVPRVVVRVDPVGPPIAAEMLGKMSDDAS